MIGEDPTLTPDDVKVRLMGTADPVARTPARYQQGAGLIDAARHWTAIRQADGYALSEDLGDGRTILTEDDYAKWEQTVWSKYGWTKSQWTKFKWTKFKWTKSAGPASSGRSTGGRSTAGPTWRTTKSRWTKYRWTTLKWAKFRWTILVEGQ